MTGHAHHAPPDVPTTATLAPPPAARAPEVSSFKLLSTLAIAGAAAGLLVVAVYKLTLPAVERYEAVQLMAAVREVLKGAPRWDTLYLENGALTRTPTSGSGRKSLPKAYVGFDAGGRELGVAVTAQEPGFQEQVLLMVGFEPASGKLIGYKVLDQKETPGLGDRIGTDTSFLAQFRGAVTPLKAVKQRDPGDPGQVQTITGATISSRAVVRIINHAWERWQPLLAAYESGGTR